MHIVFLGGNDFQRIIGLSENVKHLELIFLSHTEENVFISE